MKNSKNDVLEVFSKYLNNNTFIKAVISNHKGDYPYNKVNLKPIQIKDKILVQIEQFKDNKAYHSNLEIDETISLLDPIIESFKQFLIVTENSEYQILKNKKSSATFVTELIF